MVVVPGGTRISEIIAPMTPPLLGRGTGAAAGFGVAFAAFVANLRKP